MGTINGNLMEKLRNLSNIPESDYPFITLYMDINSHQFFDQNRKNTIFLRNSINKMQDKIKEEQGRYKLQSFRNDAEKIRNYLENELNTRAHGLAIFACDKLGIFEVFQSIMPFENEFVVNSIPHLKQLAYQADECESALVIMSDRKYAKIFQVKLGGFIIEETTFEHEVHRFHQKGGWAQLNYQRHMENQTYRHYSDVGKAATKLIDEHNYENVILIGNQIEIKRFQEFLPKRVKARVIASNSLDLRDEVNTIFETNINVILGNIIEDLKHNEDKKEYNYVEEIIEKAPVNSVTGMQDTIRLVEEGRSDLLVVPNNKTYQGWKCDGCLYIERDQHQPGCAKCNGNAKETDIVEELIRLNFRNRGKIEIVKDYAAERLEKYEGIGALVRY